MNKDQIIAKIQALPFLQQIQLSNLILKDTCSLSSLERLQQDYDTSVPEEILKALDETAEDDMRTSFYIGEQVSNECLEILSTPIHQLDLIQQLLQEIKKSEQLKEIAETEPFILGTANRMCGDIAVLKIIFSQNNGKTLDIIPTNQQHQETSP